MTVTLMVSRMMIKLQFPDQSEETNAMRETFIRVVSKGRTTGKLKIAIREKLLLALEAMAAIIVRMDDNPKLPSNNAVRNKEMLTTMLPIKSKNKPNDKTDRMDIINRLYNTFERRMACGLVMV